MMNFNKDFGKGCVGADLSRPGRGGESDKPLIHGFPTPPLGAINRPLRTSLAKN
jgi:hypothetical protein